MNIRPRSHLANVFATHCSEDVRHNARAVAKDFATLGGETRCPPRDSGSTGEHSSLRCDAMHLGGPVQRVPQSGHEKVNFPRRPQFEIFRIPHAAIMEVAFPHCPSEAAPTQSRPRVVPDMTRVLRHDPRDEVPASRQSGSSCEILRAPDLNAIQLAMPFTRVMILALQVGVLGTLVASWSSCRNRRRNLRHLPLRKE